MDTVQKYKEYVNTSFLKAVEPVVVARAEGANYFDPSGAEYLDLFAGISVVNTGHGNREVVEAAKAQLDKLMHCCSYVYYNAPMADLAETIARITPGRLKKSFFGNSGAEAVEGAMRLAKRFTGKSEFLSLTHSFHGRTLASLSLTGNADRKGGGGPFIPGVAFCPAPYHYRSPFAQKDPKMTALLCARAVEEVIRCQTSKNVAAFIIEPLMGEGGIIVPPEEYFEELLPILAKYGIILISDEVQSGFCRSGKMFASEYYGLDPEIMTLAKGIANGLPLSAFVAREDVADSFKPGDHLSTFGGNPVSCAAALANIAFMERERLADQAAAKGERLMEKLRGLHSRKVVLGEVRGRGLMIGMELVKNAETKEPATAEAAAIRALAREHHVLFGVGGHYGNVLRIQPPLTISEDQLDQGVGVLQACLEAL